MRQFPPYKDDPMINGILMIIRREDDDSISKRLIVAISFGIAKSFALRNFLHGTSKTFELHNEVFLG